MFSIPVAAGAGEKSDAERTKAVRQIRALRINPHAPRIDGRLDDEIWRKAEFFSKFTQKEPNEGESALNETAIAVVYDDEALYIGARMHCKDPDNILATVSRRDNVTNSERVLVSLDSYNDNRTAYTFGITASGVRVDYYHGADYEFNRDYDFDPVWQSAAERGGDGWNAEMRIPFSQLRFNKKDVQVWGINVNRWVPTDNEDSYFVMVPKNETGWSSRMADLVGIEGIKPSRRIEVLPYVANDATFRSGVDAGDPFRDGEEFKARIGADFKMGVGPNLTLEGTVNPDFGQVEADPAEVNLSAFETFFSERRPFFTEGSNLLNGGGAGYFYSRRIGARPHGSPDGEFVDSPDNTSILGAAKLTGRLNSGLSVGVLGAVTQREHARIFDSGVTTEEEVEPLTGYGVVRLQQEFGKEASTVGMILTGIERDVTDGSDLATFLRTRAIAGGTDWNLRFDGGKYELGGNVGFSRIEGTRAAIAEAQQSSARYFQRPDAGHTEFDPTRTSLNGWTSDLWFEKNGGEHWLWGGFAGAESPGFEINDTGRLGTADDIDSRAWVRYRENDPGRHFQSWWANASLGSGWNFDRDRQYAFLDLESVFTFKNFMGSFLGYEYFPAAQSDNLTRGGPSMGTGKNWNGWAELWSNNQKKTTWNVWGGYSEGETGGWSYNLGGGITLRPGDRWQVSFNPRWNQRVSSRQYIDTFGGGSQATFGSRYLFSSIERSQLVTQLRLNYSFTPDLSLELYAEPFAASGRYFRFGELSAARSKDLRHYGTDGTSILNNGDGTYTVTDGAQTFDFEQPDFNFLSFRSNLVMRWEWSPGSTLFLVWQQNRSDDNESGSLVGPTRLFDALSAEGDNFVALKVTYWLPFL
ncbi:MAG: DUF5916 domain-containing protein [Candidatus Krumholzibacteriia bacterium]